MPGLCGQVRSVLRVDTEIWLMFTRFALFLLFYCNSPNGRNLEQMYQSVWDDIQRRERTQFTETRNHEKDLDHCV